MLLELVKVPTVHLLEAELLLEERVNVKNRGRVSVSEVNEVAAFSSHDDSPDVADFSLESLELFSISGETSQYKFVVLFVSRPDNRSNQFSVHIESVLSASSSS